MIRTQISVDASLYARAKQVARRQGISLAELCRQGLEAVVARQPNKKPRLKPWMKYAGSVEGRPGDSQTVDEVVYGRDRP